MVTLCVVVGMSLGISFLSSILEAVLLSLTHSYVGVLVEEEVPAGIILAKLQENIDEPIAAILTLNTISHTIGAAIGGAMAMQIFGDEWMALFSAGLTFAILIFSEIIPKTLGATYWQTLSIPTAYVLRALTFIMKPVIVPLSFLNKVLTPNGIKGPTVSRAELEVMAEIGRREGTIDQEEWEVVTNVMNLDQISLMEVMTPRINIVAVPLSTSVDDAKAAMLEGGHLRLPVYDGTIDHIVGVLLARDLWKADGEGIKEVSAVVREVRFVPEMMSVEDLIRQMRKQKIKMAIVLDEFGGTSGLVTLEDLLEEIVGEIQDEHEQEPLPFEEEVDGQVRMNGSITLSEFNEKFDTELPEESYDTIGGYIFGKLERIAVEGDEVNIEEGALKVVTMDGRRIERVAFVPQGVN